MREVIAKNEIQTILTEGRSNIEVEVQEITQQILDEYGFRNSNYTSSNTTS